MISFVNVFKSLPLWVALVTIAVPVISEDLQTHDPKMKKPKVQTVPDNLLQNALPPQPNPSSGLPRKKLPTAAARSSLAEKSCDTQHSVDTYVQMTSSSQPQSDPLGGVYFVSDLRERPQIYHLSQPNYWPSQISFHPDGVANFSISPSGRFLVFASHKDGNEQFQLYLLNLSTRNVEPLTGDGSYRVESYHWGPHEDWIVFTANKRNKIDFDLYRIELPSKKETLLVEMSGLNTVTDVSPTGFRIALQQYRSIVDSDIFVFDQPKGKLTNVSASWGKASNRNGHFSADSDHLIFISDISTEKPQLRHVSLAQTGTSALLTRESDEVEDVVLAPNRKRLIYGINESGYSRFVGSEIQKDGLFYKPFAVPSRSDSIVSEPHFVPAGTDPNAFFFTQTSSTVQLGVWKWHQGKKTAWTQPNRGLIDPKCFSREKLIKYRSFDGLEIPAFLYVPRSLGSEKRPIPFVLYSHGGPEAQYRPAFSKIFQYFLQRGFGILAPNIRGSSGYGKTYVALDDYKKRMDSIKDTLEGARWLITEGYTLPDRLGIFGGSYGGFVVLRSIQEGHELFSAAAESVGITDFVTFLKNTKPYRRALRETEYGPLSDESFLKSISPMSFVSKIRTPLLIFHGANDPRVPVNETEQLAANLKERNVPVEVKIFSDEGHGNTKLSNILEQARIMVHFFESRFSQNEKKGL